MRETLAPHDLVIVLGAGVLRLYIYEPGPFLEPGTQVAVVSDDPAQLHRSAAALAVLAAPGPLAAAVAALVEPRPFDPAAARRHQPPPPPAPPAAGEPLRPGHVFEALARLLPANAILVEESPSSRPELLEWVLAREPMGFVANANGGLGFGISSAIGLRMGAPDRPVVAVLGDGSIMYSIQALWTAARYGVGVLAIVMANGGYTVMDGLARSLGRTSAWPTFEEVRIAPIAEALGACARRIERHDELGAALEEAIGDLATASRPLVLDVAVAP
jgi:benzoylformate decarboxylase